MRKLMAVLALAAFGAACNDQPAAPDDDASLDPSVHQTHHGNIPRPRGHGWTLMYTSGTIEVYPGYPPLPCLSTPTEPVTADWHGRWAWWMKDYARTWLRGKPMHTWVTQWDAYLLDSKGRRWDLERIEQTVLITRTSMESTAWTGPDPTVSWYVNRATGERFVLYENYMLGADHLPPPVEYTMYETLEYRCELIPRHHHH
jgi:hypothetical protein